MFTSVTFHTGMESLSAAVDAVKLQSGNSSSRKEHKTPKALDFEGSVVLITGAASGECIGTLIAGLEDLFS